ncbi:hypothetical protein SELSPUOL_02003 [Selenomonas sputigena ATCC 35185]|uniref:Uncharacterized protein n=1 Tax=Selenomonas sputigena (strain ATCC 35185 / DSM 20758 / CCUG 44933 / VPI D19B-28) TaxID=546271 RepID=C9LWZ7_SELS3|nr:hypothetical protein SELSPUOL_02003 [Selenomonas sputigena ATCC 35185]
MHKSNLTYATALFQFQIIHSFYKEGFVAQRSWTTKSKAHLRPLGLSGRGKRIRSPALLDNEI